MSIVPIEGLPEVEEGADLASLVLQGVDRNDLTLRDGDVVCVSQKIVSKAEGAVVELSSVEPSDVSRVWADRYDKDPRVVEIVLREANRVVRMERGVIITETSHGFVCANSGVDSSNSVGRGVVTLLPSDPDASARRLRRAIEERTDSDVAVIVTDTFGRPWRKGFVNFAIGLSGIAPQMDYRGETDPSGYELRVTQICVADEIAAASELVMGKTSGIPVAIVRGYDYPSGEAKATEIIRKGELDLFR